MWPEGFRSETYQAMVQVRTDFELKAKLLKIFSGGGGGGEGLVGKERTDLAIRVGNYKFSLSTVYS